MKKILLLSKYGDWEENSYYRFYQYFPNFISNNIEITGLPLFSKKIEKDFIEHGKISLWNHINSYFKRLLFLSQNTENSVIWMDTELFPYIPFGWESLLIPIDTPIIMDIYNSFFYKYSHGLNFLGKKIFRNKVPLWISRADEVIVSSNAIYSFSKKWKEKIHLYPLALPIMETTNQTMESKDKKEFILGWTGSPFTARFLNLIAEPLRDLSRYFPIKLKLIGGEISLPIQTEFYPWSRKKEMEILNEIDIGLNPLPATLRELGNPGLKTLKYMSLGKPILSSPFGGSENFVIHSENGFLAKSVDDWHIALRLLLEDSGIRKEMGQKSKERFQNHFNKEDGFEKLYPIFNKYC